MSNEVVLFAGEAEQTIQSLRPMKPEEVGGPDWRRQQEYIDKLTVQAVLSARNQSDEYIKEFLITYQKIDILIESLICFEVWRENILTKMINEDRCPKQTFGLYGLLYGEATIVTLLETVLYHSDTMQALNMGLLDLVDYCHRSISKLLSRCEDMEYRQQIHAAQSGLDHTSASAEITNHQNVLSFQIGLKCLSILHYLIDHMSLLPLSLSSRLFNTFDIPLILVEVIYKSPWLVELSNGKMFKFIDNKWIEQESLNDIRNSVSKMEGQVWLSIYQLILSKECRDKYDLGGHRKTALLKLRSFLSDVIIDQLPMLGDLRRFLEQLSLSEPANIKPNLVIEQIAEFRDTILRDSELKWNVIYGSFLTYMDSDECKKDLDRQAKSWAETYNLDCVDQLIMETPRCPVCGNEAAKRCSRCKSEWYCRRECQVQHWSKHKKSCDLFNDAGK